MIALSEFGYERGLDNPSTQFSYTWQTKQFIHGEKQKVFEETLQHLL